ncbi:MAG: general secretion pathway protein GspA [Lysobacteraceae bacterium]|nr:MAG: general secretion pathway protein GspA [Xanthomonadaceae bacterium]
MYLDFYGLKEAPFAITPDPRFVFLSERHRDALAHLLYGIGQGGSGGFVQLTGEVGTGKTTLCRLLLEQLPQDTRVALVLNPRLSPVELLETICEELKIDLTGRRGSLKGLVDALNTHLLEAYAQGLRVVLIIDEAQNLSTEALEQIRLLTNLETPTQKLLQIILLGQPELRDLLARPELRQLAQRITARYHLTPLSVEETEAYVRHRLAVAGCTRMPFTRLALRRLHQHAEGIPRLINVIADRALMAGYVHNRQQIGERDVDLAAQESLQKVTRRWPRPGVRTLAALLVLAIVAAVALWPVPDPPQPPPPKPGPDAESLAPLPRIEDLLAESSFGLHAAWTSLLALWTVRAEEVDVLTAMRCPPQLAPGLYCLRGSGSLAKLQTLRRPVILRLSAGGREGWAVLVGLSPRRGRLLLGGERIDVSRRDLENCWLGEFFAIWQAPVFLPAGNLKRGDTGPGVEWLQERLVQRGLLPAPRHPAVFDLPMEAAVRSLQAAHGLVPDGIVGPETLLALTSDLPGGPRLRTRLE